MYLSCVKIKNFRGYGENTEREDRCYVYDGLDAPLVIFKGYNGFGKTSFYEAIEWCLTDSVYRLKKIYKDKTYQVNELKKSHYLKFYHPIEGNSSDREIYVELIFSDGLKIIRRSRSNVLQTTDKDTLYKSTVTMGRDELSEVNNKKILQEFISTAKNIGVFFHTHMLGQESISDFLRHNSPSQRREIFMQLLQEEELNSLYLDVQKYINGKTISKKSNQLKTKIDDYIDTQNNIEKFISNLGFNSIEEYINSLHQHYIILKELIEGKDEYKEELEIDSLFFNDKINIQNCVAFMREVIFSQAKLTTLKESFVVQKADFNRLKGKLETFKLLNAAKFKIKQYNHAKKLLDNNVNDLQKKMEEIKESKLLSEKILKEHEDILIKLQTKKDTFLSLKHYIKDLDLEIKEEFWIQIQKEKGILDEFVLEYKHFSQENGQNIEINTKWFEITRKKYDELQFKIKKNKEDLEKIRKIKEEVSSLNREYQKALSQVKKLIKEKPDIKSCPVCLNDDFSDGKYLEKNINNWESDSSVSDKIVAIIDTTSSSGNDEIKELTNKENECMDEIKSLQESLKQEVILQITNRVDKIRNKFVVLFQSVKDKINEKIDVYDNLVENQQNEYDNALKKYNKLLDSINALFESEEEFKKSKLDVLKQFIISKEEWFKKHSSKIDLFNDSVDLLDIENEITILKEEKVNEYTEDGIAEKIKEVNEKNDFLEVLLSEFNKIIKFRIPVEYESTLEEYDNLENKISKLNEKKKTVDGYSDKINNIHGKLLGKQRRIVKERLEKHPIISWVYETINPHPFHKKLHITNTERGTNFTGETQLDDKIELYLDQMFSAAQLNILALSIFLGLGLTQRYSNLQQLFLDDPIQSMDDVNILALIDVIRAIMDSRYSDNHMIISTHNEDFAQLIAIKMRNRGIVQYNITGYTEEGPKIKKILN
ncbi:AAA family ATPase [Guptibacillus hwajinpoensis]|uniref:AAA family ATPase n=1 Tax=Guptibacillus hwajinpoensis TaxID=208199 RepID=UPI001CD3602B|nr:AAA family ATPase [Pseudalkalibacillus hwajinpoensis]MCA0992752.1 AAA family ATPase [Pseudalkalibacillus hwajinpoensis]